MQPLKTNNTINMINMLDIQFHALNQLMLLLTTSFTSLLNVYGLGLYNTSWQI
jgi:hypothetical protein